MTVSRKHMANGGNIVSVYEGQQQGVLAAVCRD